MHFLVLYFSYTMKITTVAFDGMHRCGKWTQIGLLKTAAQSKYDLVLSLRGEHYREGTGDDHLTDPYSPWWQEHKTSTNYAQKSALLQRELRVFFQRNLPNHMRLHQLDTALVILDRSVVGRYMFCHADGETINQQDFLRIQTGKSYQHIHNIIIPDLIFVLQPTEKKLLERLHAGIAHASTAEAQSLRNRYKLRYIPEKYTSYYAWLQHIPAEIQSRIDHIRSDAPSHLIHEHVINELQSRELWPSSQQYIGENNKHSLMEGHNTIVS